MNVFITGMSGFIGSHLADFLLTKKNVIVYGTYYNKQLDYCNIKHLEKNKRVKILKLDVTDAKATEKIIKKVKPKIIFHLAAQSFPTVSWEDPAGTININMNGTVNVFEAVKKHKLNTNVVVACSSAEYGFEDAVPVSEDNELKPLHPYGVSKVGQDFLAYQYFKNFGIKTQRIRIFNTTGPRKTNDVCSDFTKRIVEVEKGIRKNPIPVGNLDAYRAFTDVRDMVEGLWISSQKGVSGEVYNICADKVYEISAVLEIMKELSTTHIEYKVDNKILRPTDEIIIMGDNAKFKNDTGWSPKHDIHSTIKNMLDYWRQVL